MKKIISLIMSAAMTFTVVLPYCDTEIFAEDSVINIEEHTPQEIKQYVESHKFNIDYNDTYKSEPSAKYPYKIGELSDESLENALNALNCMRYIAGLQEVSLNSEYSKLAQAAALVDNANNELTHYPEQPSDMPDELYELGKKGAASSNITSGKSSHTPAYSILLYMNDSDKSNISSLGHRRWCINPIMNETGFGMSGSYSAMYSTDMSRTDASETGVCWPAKNTPVEYFSPLENYPYSSAWSISMGKYIDGENVEVTLTRKSDSKKWNFSDTSADGDFYVDNSYRGQIGCIIFRPSDISYSAGDAFNVKITGTEEPIEYTVNFFSLSDIPNESVTYSLGDVNGDGLIDASDASAVLAEYAVLSTTKTSSLNAEQKKAADINSDGFIDSSDASKILGFYSYLSTTSHSVGIEEWLLF